MKNIVRNIFNVLMSFALIFIILSIMLFNIINDKILNKNYILSKMEETEFYLQVSREIKNGFENYIYQSVLPEDTIENIVSDEMIKKDVNGIVDYIYEGKEISLSSEDVKSNLDVKIQNYVTTQNLKLNEQGKNNITEFEKIIVNEYINNVKISETFYNMCHSMINKVNEQISKIKNLPFIALIVVIILMILINIKELLNVINFGGISLLSTGILIKLGINLIMKKVEFDNLVIITNSLSNLIVSIIKENIYKILDFSNIYIICGIVAIIISAILKNLNVNKENIYKPKRRGIKQKNN